MELLSRADAIAQGLKQYFDGTPCGHGNVAARTVSNKNCTCAVCAAVRRDAAKEKRAADPDAARSADRARYAADSSKYIEAAKRYYAEHAEKIRTKIREQRRNNPAKNQEVCRKWRESNPDYDRQRYAADPQRHRDRCRDWRTKNPDMSREKVRLWRQENPHLHAALVAKRRASKLRATPSWLTRDDRAAMVAIYAEARRLTRETGILHHVDHEVPLSGEFVSGLHVPWNLRPIPALDNLRKSNRHVP